MQLATILVITTRSLLRLIYYEEVGVGAMLKNGKNPIVNPWVVLREEFDDWAVLFDPDTGHGFGLSPTGAYVWKLLDGEHTIDALLDEIRQHADNVPEDTSDHIAAFVDALVAEGLAALGGTGSCGDECLHAPIGGLNEVRPFTYAIPRLVNLSSGHGSYGGSCYAGAGATVCCSSGTCGTNNPSCCAGTCGSVPACCGGACDGRCTSVPRPDALALALTEFKLPVAVAGLGLSPLAGPGTIPVNVETRPSRTNGQ